MRSVRCLTVLCGVLLWSSATLADVTDTTPYDYDKPPAAGKEGGTYAISATGTAGPGCSAVAVGTIKLLPNAAGTGGKACSKINFELDGTGPTCALAPMIEPVLQTVGGTYTLNGDGTACFRLAVIGGPLDGIPTAIHAYLSPDGKTAVFSNQDTAYPCPGASGPLGGLPVIGGLLGSSLPLEGATTAAGTSIKISRFGDEPPGSGKLPCP